MIDRYARQTIVPGVGRQGQQALADASVRVDGRDFASFVCASYLAGAGIGRLEVDDHLIGSCRALNSDIVIETRAASQDMVAVELMRDGNAPVRFAPADDTDPVSMGSRAALWILVEVFRRQSERG